MSIRLNKAVITATLILILASQFYTAKPFFVEASQEKLSLAKPLSLEWEYRSSTNVNLTLVAEKRYALLSLSDGRLVGVRLDDGGLVWQTEFGGSITTTPVADSGTIFVFSTSQPHNDSQDSHISGLRAIGLTSGVTQWFRPFPSIIDKTIVATETYLFVCGIDGILRAVRKTDGEIIWATRNSIPFTSPPAIRGETIFIGDADGTVFSVDAKTGRILRRFSFGSRTFTPPLPVGDTLFIASANNQITALSLLSGKRKWRRNLKGGVQSILPTSKGLVVTSRDNFALLYNYRHGSLIWKRQLTGRIIAPPLATQDEVLFAPVNDDECVVVDLSSGRKVNEIFVGEDNSTTAPPLISGERLLIPTRKGLLAFR